MATINQQFMQRVKYGLVNLALIILVITLACVSTWAITAAALWQSIIVSALTYAWYQKLQLPVNNELVYYLIPLTIAMISFTLPTLYTPNFFFILLSILSIFNILFDDFILLTPLKPYFMTATVPADGGYGTEQVQQEPEATEYILSQDLKVPENITCDPGDNPCLVCYEKLTRQEWLMFAQPKSELGKHNTQLSSYYHLGCFTRYTQHSNNKAISTMPNGNEMGAVSSWYLGEYIEGRPATVKIQTCYLVKKAW